MMLDCSGFYAALFLIANQCSEIPLQQMTMPINDFVKTTTFCFSFFGDLMINLATSSILIIGAIDSSSSSSIYLDLFFFIIEQPIDEEEEDGDMMANNNLMVR